MHRCSRTTFESSKARIADNQPLVSVVIPTFNRRRDLADLLNSIINGNYPVDKLQVIIVDDCSSDGTEETVRMFSRENRALDLLYIRHARETLVGQSINDGILKAKSEYVFVIDDDNTIDGDAIHVLVNSMVENANLAVAGPVTYYRDSPKRVQYAGCTYSRVSRKTSHQLANLTDIGQIRNRMMTVDAIPNSFMVRRSVALRAGLIPTQKIPWNGEDGYLQYKMKMLGYRVVVLGDAKVFHRRPLDIKQTYNPMRLYFALRSKIVFHSDLDTGLNRFTFFLFVPAYLFWYVRVGLLLPRPGECTKAVVLGTLHGLLYASTGRIRNRYFAQ